PAKVSAFQSHCEAAVVPGGMVSQLTAPAQATGWLATSTCAIAHRVSQPGGRQSCGGTTAASAGGIGVSLVGRCQCFWASVSPTRAAPGCGARIWHSVGG